MPKVTTKKTNTSKKTEKKVPTKRDVGTVVKKQAKLKISTEKNTSLKKEVSLPLIDIKGKETKKVNVPVELFGQSINNQLLAQAIRVYQEHERAYKASVKTRGEVTGSTRKIYKQKGTGRARHGANRAPIFVHGGVAHGPKLKNTKLSLSQKMRRGALVSALSNQYQAGLISVIDDTRVFNAKTTAYAELFHTIGIRASTLVVTGNTMTDAIRAMRNIRIVHPVRAKDLNAYIVMKHTAVVFLKDSLEELKKYFLRDPKTANGIKVI